MGIARVSEAAHAILPKMTGAQGVPMETMLDTANEEHRKRDFLIALNDDFAALRSKHDEWSDELEERVLWEPTLRDGAEKE